MVQRNVALAPIVNPVTPDVGEEAVVIVAAPLTTLQVPVPDVGALPARVAVVTLQIFWSGPAEAVVPGAATSITTSSVELAHTPLAMVQRNVTAAPTVKPVNPEVAEVGVVMVAAPLTTDHTPLPVVGVLPAKVAVVTLQRF